MSDGDKRKQCVVNHRDDYVGAGVLGDCKRFLKKFDELRDQNSALTIDKFREEWKAAKFNYIYYGCNSFAEIVELTEEILSIAKLLWMQPNDLHKRVVRFYLLAILYIKQPFVNPHCHVKIRLTPEEYESLNKFYDECVQLNVNDVELVFELLYFQSAFHACASNREYGLAALTRQKLVRDSDLFNTPSNVPTVKDVFKANGFYEELSDEFGLYHKAKCILNTLTKTENSELLLLNVDSPKELHSIAFPNEALCPKEGGEAKAGDEEEDSIRKRRSIIKNRAFKKIAK